MMREKSDIIVKPAPFCYVKNKQVENYSDWKYLVKDKKFSSRYARWKEKKKNRLHKGDYIIVLYISTYFSSSFKYFVPNLKTTMTTVHKMAQRQSSDVKF